VEAMSLYNHVRNKGDLLDGVAGLVFGSIPLPDATLPWDERLHFLLLGAHQALTDHPVVVRALAAEQANPRSLDALRFIDAVLGALFDAGLDERDAVRRYRSLLGLVFGSVLVTSADATADNPERAEPVDVWFVRNVRADTLPRLHRALPALLDTDCGAEFTQVLDFALDGLRAAAVRRSTPRPV